MVLLCELIKIYLRQEYIIRSFHGKKKKKVKMLLFFSRTKISECSHSRDVSVFFFFRFKLMKRSANKTYRTCIWYPYTVFSDVSKVILSMFFLFLFHRFNVFKIYHDFCSDTIRSKLIVFTLEKIVCVFKMKKYIHDIISDTCRAIIFRIYSGKV